MKGQNRMPSFIYVYPYLCSSGLHQYVSVVGVLLWLHIVHMIYFTLYIVNKIIYKLCYLYILPDCFIHKYVLFLKILLLKK
jgi:hypothetical protein